MFYVYDITWMHSSKMQFPSQGLVSARGGIWLRGVCPRECFPGGVFPARADIPAMDRILDTGLWKHFTALRPWLTCRVDQIGYSRRHSSRWRHQNPECLHEELFEFWMASLLFNCFISCSALTALASSWSSLISDLATLASRASNLVLRSGSAWTTE